MYIEFEYLAPTVCFDDNKVMLRRSALRSIVLYYYCILSIVMDLFKHNESVQRTRNLWVIRPTIPSNSNGLKCAYTLLHKRHTYKHLWDSRPTACCMRVRVNAENTDTSRLVSKNVSRSLFGRARC